MHILSKISKLISSLSSLHLGCGRGEDIEILLPRLQLLPERLKLRVHDLVTLCHFGQFTFSKFDMLLMFQVFFLTASELLIRMEKAAFSRLGLKQGSLEMLTLCFGLLELVDDGGSFHAKGLRIFPTLLELELHELAPLCGHGVLHAHFRGLFERGELRISVVL